MKLTARVHKVFEEKNGVVLQLTTVSIEARTLRLSPLTEGEHDLTIIIANQSTATLSSQILATHTDSSRMNGPKATLKWTDIALTGPIVRLPITVLECSSCLKVKVISRPYSSTCTTMSFQGMFNYKRTFVFFSDILKFVVWDAETDVSNILMALGKSAILFNPLWLRSL